MKNEKKRPKLYFKPKDVLEQSMREPSRFPLYLHQNMTQFYGDVGDMADELELMSQ